MARAKKTIIEEVTLEPVENTGNVIEGVTPALTGTRSAPASEEPEAQSRIEGLLLDIINAEPTDIVPQSRNEALLKEIVNKYANLIDDTETAEDKTWSSDKIQDVINGLPTPSEVGIDDTQTLSNKTWSSEKISGLDVNKGNGNVAVGQNTLQSTSGANNTALGVSALQNDTSGGYNVGIGRSAGDTIATGGNNTVIGYNSDVASASTTAAAAFGKTAIAGEHSAALGANTDASGAYSVAVGDSAQATSNNALALGRKAHANYVGAVAIGVDDQGNGAEATKKNQIKLGTSRHIISIEGKTENMRLSSPTPNPTTGDELAPSIDAWSGTGATWSGSYWEMAAGDSIATTFTAEADIDYIIALTVSNAITPNAEVKPLTIALDNDSISIFGANDANWVVVLKSSTSGTITVTIGGATWSGRISNVSIKKMTAYFTPDFTVENRNLHAYGTNVVFGSGQSKMAITQGGNTAVGYNSQDALNTGKGNTAVGIKTQKVIVWMLWMLLARLMK